MTTPANNFAISTLRDCALSLQDNAAYMLGELSNLQIPETLRQQISEGCDSLIATKHDVIDVLAELNELSTGETRRRLERCLEWMRQELEQMHPLVKALEAEAEKEASAAPAYLLVAESTVNMLEAFQRARQAMESF